MKHIITCALTAATLAVGAVSAHAGCADPRTISANANHVIPGFIVANMRAKGSSASAQPGDAAQNVVCTGLVTYRANQKPFGQALIQWHSDGTEWENINFPILGGNICLGAWQAVDATHVSRFHMGWLYTQGDLSGYFTETETDRVAHPDQYVGAFDFKIFDLNGNVLSEFPGTSDAVRLAP